MNVDFILDAFGLRECDRELIKFSLNAQIMGNRTYLNFSRKMYRREKGTNFKSKLSFDSRYVRQWSWSVYLLSRIESDFTLSRLYWLEVSYLSSKSNAIDFFRNRICPIVALRCIRFIQAFVTFFQNVEYFKRIGTVICKGLVKTVRRASYHS